VHGNLLCVYSFNLNRNHPDIPCTDITKSGTNCIGKEFGISSSDKWYNPISKYHGTHVAGTIGATALNNDGIQGVINDGKFCFIIGRVFGEADAGASMSNILKAVEWMVSMGVNVINMSLGSETGTLTARSVMQKAYDKGVILVGASGNDGTNAQHYPASFTSVLSVAAVDENRNKAAFSQYNTGVDIAAPGVNILSASPLGTGGVTLLSSSTVAVVGDYMKYAVKANVSGVLFDCPNYGISACPGPGKHICLIKR
jgi:serine protease